MALPAEYVSTEGSCGIPILTYESDISSYMNRSTMPLKINLSGYLTFYTTVTSSGAVAIFANSVDTNGNLINRSTPYSVDQLRLSYMEINYFGIDRASLTLNFNAVIQPNTGFKVLYWTTVVDTYSNPALKILYYCVNWIEYI